MPITRESLYARHDLPATAARVEDVIRSATATPDGTIAFIGQYTWWMGHFGSGIASLAGKIGRARGLFFDPMQPVRTIADRSVYIASHVFDAAREPFDDDDNPERDTHRCLAQALLLGLVQHYDAEPARVDRLCEPTRWMGRLRDRVGQGYGATAPDDLTSIARALGYHLGTRVLPADEARTIDQLLQTRQPALHADLQTREVELNGVAHRCCAWLTTRLTDATDPFDDGIGPVRLALTFLPDEAHDIVEAHVMSGFDDFVRDHTEFFARCLRPDA